MERRPDANPLKTDAGPSATALGPDGGPRFRVKAVQFTPSEVFTPEALKAFAATVEGREIAFADVQALLARINEAYKARNIVTSRAVVEAQDVSDGILDIRLVEGRLGAVTLTGNTTTRDDYVRDRIGLKPGQLVDLPTLEADLKRFNRTNDVQLAAELKAGTAFGTSDLLLSAQEPPRHDLRVLVDNNGSRSTGLWRAGIFYTNRSLTGLRDDLSLTTIHAEGQQSYSVGYGFSVNPRGGRLWLGYFEDHTQVKNGPLSSLDLTGTARSAMATLRQPIPAWPGTQLDGLLTLKKRKSVNRTSGVFLQESDSLDASVGAELWQASAEGFWLASYSFTLGEADSPTRKSYSAGRAALRGSRKLDNGWSLVGNVNLQHTSDDQLIAGEQMLIGGEGTVRGYNVGASSGEKGYALSLEAHHPLGTATLGDETATVTTSGFLFVDHGRVQPYRPPASTLAKWDELTSAGWGIQATIAKRVSVRAVLAQALNETPDGQKGLHVRVQIVAGVL